MKTLIDILGRDRLYLNVQPERLELKTYNVEAALLIPHEDVIRNKVDLVARDIEVSGYVKYPILVDARSFIVLDGHHRLQALKEIGIPLIPAFFVDYTRDYIHVCPSRKEIHVNKTLILKKALEEKTNFPPKTTKHILIGMNILPIYTKLEKLEKTENNPKLPAIT